MRFSVRASRRHTGNLSVSTAGVSAPTHGRAEQLLAAQVCEAVGVERADVVDVRKALLHVGLAQAHGRDCQLTQTLIYL